MTPPTPLGSRYHLTVFKWVGASGAVHGHKLVHSDACGLVNDEFPELPTDSGVARWAIAKPFQLLRDLGRRAVIQHRVQPPRAPFSYERSIVRLPRGNLRPNGPGRPFPPQATELLGVGGVQVQHLSR
jgi:hypothetical protein